MSEIPRPGRPGFYARVIRDGKVIASRWTKNIVTVQGLQRNTFGDRTQTNNFNAWYPLLFTAGAITIHSTAQASGVTEFPITRNQLLTQLTDTFFWFGSALINISGSSANIIGAALVSYPGPTASPFPAVDQLWGGGNFSVPIPVAPGDEFQLSYLLNTRFQDSLGVVP